MKMLSVTRILSPFNDFSQVPPDRLAAAATRGTEVHHACAAHARGLPVFLVEGQPHFESFKRWFERYVKRVLFVEDDFADTHIYFINGHPDIVCELTDGRIVVVDYKTPVAESRLWRSQISCYCYLVAPVLGCMPEGMALMLNGKGKAAKGKLYQYQAEDFACFLAALTCYRAFKE